eukprot:956059-Rhodomonas_salina.1
MTLRHIEPRFLTLLAAAAAAETRLREALAALDTERSALDSMRLGFITGSRTLAHRSNNTQLVTKFTGLLKIILNVSAILAPSNQEAVKTHSFFLARTTLPAVT